MQLRKLQLGRKSQESMFRYVSSTIHLSAHAASFGKNIRKSRKANFVEMSTRPVPPNDTKPENSAAKKKWIFLNFQRTENLNGT